MDAMTSAEVGLKATLRFGDAELPLPSDELLTPQDRVDFRDAQILAAYLKLCSIRSDIAEVVGRLQEEDFINYQQVVQEPLQRLDQWRLELPAQYSFEFSCGIPPAMLAFQSMRSLASVYLRYYQVSTVAFEFEEIALRHVRVTLYSYVRFSSSFLQRLLGNVAMAYPWIA